MKISTNLFHALCSKFCFCKIILTNLPQPRFTTIVRNKNRNVVNTNASVITLQSNSRSPSFNCNTSRVYIPFRLYFTIINTPCRMMFSEFMTLLWSAVWQYKLLETVLLSCNGRKSRPESLSIWNAIKAPDGGSVLQVTRENTWNSIGTRADAFENFRCRKSCLLFYMILWNVPNLQVYKNCLNRNFKIPQNPIQQPQK